MQSEKNCLPHTKSSCSLCNQEGTVWSHTKSNCSLALCSKERVYVTHEVVRYAVGKELFATQEVKLELAIVYDRRIPFA